jgi:hypothetical protein
MKRQEVIGRCMQLGVPIFHGRIDKTLFQSSMRSLDSVNRGQGRPRAT